MSAQYNSSHVLVRKLSLCAKDGVPDPETELLRQRLNIIDLEIIRDYYIQFERDLLQEELSRLARELSGGVQWDVVMDRAINPAREVQVAHRSGIVDNESSSLVTICSLLAIPALAAKTAKTYRSSSSTLSARVDEYLVNRNIQELHLTEPAYSDLTPAGEYLPPAIYDLRSYSEDELIRLGHDNGRNLSPDKMRILLHLQQSLALPHITDVLIEAVDARWSDHCSHTTWRSRGNLLSRLERATLSTGNENIVSMFHDNAGVWRFYEGWALAIKAETHNGPSAVSAYFGQLTKLGGVLRDILGTGLGANPIGCFEYTAIGIPGEPPPLHDRPDARHIAIDTIRAIKEYGNTFGVPMMWSHMTFHRSYRAKPFALGGSVGLVPIHHAQRGIPRPQDLVVLIGGLTGNEGIHGASSSSAGATMDSAAVQIGAPLEQVKFRNAILELRDAGAIRAITDIGGAGLNSAVGEMGEACGVWINTALVPLKTSALPMWRILLSESQERMLLAISPERLGQSRSILARHLVRATVIGRFVDTGRYTVFHSTALDEETIASLPEGNQPHVVGDVGFDVPYDLIHYEPDQIHIPDRQYRPQTPGKFPPIQLADLAEILERVMADGDIASQAYADEQYDSTVQGNTVYGPSYGRNQRVPTNYWAGSPLEGSPAACIVSTAFNPWLFSVDPVLALRQLFCRVVAGQVLAGVELHDICLCDNFYTPHLSDGADHSLVALVDELSALIRYFGVPVISGKDSSAGSTMTNEGIVSVPPAVFLTALGKVPNAGSLLPEAWQQPEHVLVRIGPETGSPSGTVAGRILELAQGALDGVDCEAYERFLSVVRASRHMFYSGTLIGAGGVASQLLLSSLASGLGVDISSQSTTFECLLEEHRCGALIEMDERNLGELPVELRPVMLGRLAQNPGLRVNGVELATPQIYTAWSSTFAASLL